MTSCKSLFAVLGAIALSLALAVSASAGRLSTSSQTFRSSFRELRVDGAFGSINCRITLEGSIHTRTITKTGGSLIGYVTAANLGTCSQGSATVLRELLPWHIRYSSFSGTLPSIASIRTDITEFSLRIREPVFAITCLAESDSLHPAVATFNREAGGSLTTTTISGADIPALCEPNNFSVLARFSSDAGLVTVLNSATRITVTLI